MNKQIKLTNSTKDKIAGILFSSPFIIGFLLFFLSPIITYFAMSFSILKLDDNGAMDFIANGFKNYYNVIFEQNTFISNLFQGVTELIITCPAIIFYSLFIAIILNEKFKGRIIARAIFFLPVLIASGVTLLFQTDALTNGAVQAISGTAAVGQAGTISLTKSLLNIIGDSFSGPISDAITFLMNKIYFITMSSGVQILIFLAGLQGIPKHVYEACSIEGCSTWETFWKITLPMISPLILVNAIYTIIDILGSPTNLVINLLYSLSIRSGDYGASAAMGIMYFIVIFILVGVIFYVMNKFVYYEEK